MGYGVALQASWLEGFDSLGLHQILSLCNVNLVDGLIWSQEAVGSNPTMETNFISAFSEMDIISVFEIEGVGSIPTGPASSL